MKCGFENLYVDIVDIAFLLITVANLRFQPSC